MYVNYPKKASDNATEGYTRNLIKGSCNNKIGERTAIKLMNREPLNEKFLRKIYSYLSRAKVYVGDKDRCGYISYQMWGGKEMLNYCKKVLK